MYHDAARREGNATSARGDATREETHSPSTDAVDDRHLAVLAPRILGDAAAASEPGWCNEWVPDTNERHQRGTDKGVYEIG